VIGAIAGDIIGSVHEGAGTKTKDFPLFADGCRFTDDTVLTVAVADCILHGGSYAQLYHDYFHAYPDVGFSQMFSAWAAQRRREPFGSFGNGAAMRVSPIGFACGTLTDVLARARQSAEVSHDHPDGIRGAQATAAAVFLARMGSGKNEIRVYLEWEFGYDLNRSLDEIRPDYRFDATCPGSVPQSIIAFLESSDYEDAVRNAISLGGDADTMACIAGAIAEAFYGGVPEHIRAQALARLDARLLTVVRAFNERFGAGGAGARLSATSAHP
jgi:ADP-ribosylglycohydrolase